MKFFQGLVACIVLISAAQAQNQTSVRFRFWKPKRVDVHRGRLEIAVDGEFLQRGGQVDRERRRRADSEGQDRAIPGTREAVDRAE